MQRELHGDECLQKLESPEDIEVDNSSQALPPQPVPPVAGAINTTTDSVKLESIGRPNEMKPMEVIEVKAKKEATVEPEAQAPIISPSNTLKRQSSNSRESSPKRRMPFYKTLQLGKQKFAVDAFQYKAIEGVSAYFLSHFHSDHYGGLSKAWTHGPIYCSPATARLVHMQLRVDPEYLREVPIGVPTEIEGVEVIFLDANHCPGAVVILFDRHTLHTGDFRASQSLLNSVKQLTPRLKTVYLDTTYLDPLRRFPEQSQVVQVCADYCAKVQKKPASRSFFTAQRPRRILVMVGTYTIGKERIAMGIARALESRIFAVTRKKRILEALGDDELESLLEQEDGLKCQVHLAPMGAMTIAKLEDQWNHLKKHYTDLIAFVPTGWTWPTKSKIDPAEFDAAIMTAKATTRGPLQICRVPYSEHSSFTELENFCRGIPIGRLIATVGTSNLDILKSWESPI